MWNEKSFWYGLSIGLILTATLLRLISVSSDAAQSNEPGNLEEEPSHETANDKLNELSEEELVSLADAHGLALYDQKEKRYSQEDMDQAIKEAQEAQETTTTLIYVIAIESGMGTGDVANLLVKVGLIDEELQFQRTMTRLNLHYSIQPGIYRIAENTALEDIAHSITSGSP